MSDLLLYVLIAGSTGVRRLQLVGRAQAQGPARTQRRPGGRPRARPRTPACGRGPEPHQGQVRGGPRHAIQRACLTAGWEAPRFFETTPEDPGHSQVRAALEYGADVVLVGGGDGTVRVVAESLAHTGVAMGLIPLGTGNLLARNVDLDVYDLHGTCADRPLRPSALHRYGPDADREFAHRPLIKPRFPRDCRNRHGCRGGGRYQRRAEAGGGLARLHRGRRPPPARAAEESVNLAGWRAGTGPQDPERPVCQLRACPGRNRPHSPGHDRRRDAGRGGR